MVEIAQSPAHSTATAADARERVVVVQRLTKTFRDFWLRARAKAINDVSFEIRRGEIFGLLGPNGSGKSTTIKVLLGLLHKTSGLVSVFGKLPSDVSVKKRIGYLPEESYLYPFLNARETLEFYAKLFEIDGSVRRRRIDELLDMVGLTAVQHRQVREYSKGMQRRIGIAQALINDPELLILDEPTTGLDPIGTRQVKDLIHELGRRGKTVLLSSHLLSDVEDCVDRMVILYGGRIQAEGTCDQLLEVRDKTVIECDALDDATISQIDAVIRQRSHGERAINRVSRPRQRLEELFVNIVERASAENQETSGAQHGGETAAFLRAERDTGEALVESLLAAGRDAGSAAETQQAQTAKPLQSSTAGSSGADLNVLSGLLRDSQSNEVVLPEPGAPSSPAKPAAPKAQPPDVDLGVIGALLDNPDSPPSPPGAPAKGGTGPERRT
jgi:ABC-2 type transport system ATP-binding protein